MQTQVKELPTLKGTEGKSDYLAFAAHDGVVLGVKILPILARDKDTVLFGARIRAVFDTDVFGDQSTNVVSLKSKKMETPGEAFSSITWERSDSSRSSTVITMLLKGDLVSADGLKVFLSNLTEQKLSSSLYDYLETLAGHDAMKLSKQQVVDWVEETFLKHLIKKITGAITVKEAVDSELSTVGVFKTNAEILKKAYDKMKAEQDTDA